MPKFKPLREPSQWRALTACLLVLQLSSPAFLLAQEPMQQPAPSMQHPGQANEATSKPISETPAAAMTTLQATLPPSQTENATGAAAPLTRDEQALMVLSRFTYGPRPGDLERLKAEGLSKWFTGQFNPQNLDDSLLERKLDDYPAMKLPIGKLMEMYPNNQMIRATMNGKAGVPYGEGERALYNAQMERYKERKDGKPNDAATSDPESLPWEIPSNSKWAELCLE